jgi:hypothetical protein
VYLLDVVRIKLACQLPAVAFASASSYKALPGFPNNSVAMRDDYCIDAAINQPTPARHCFQDALHFSSFAMLASTNDPDGGNQYPGYILYQQNTTRVCQSIVSEQCLQEHAWDEELCLAMLIAASTRGSDAYVWTAGAIAGVAIAGEHIIESSCSWVLRG